MTIGLKRPRANFTDDHQDRRLPIPWIAEDDRRDGELIEAGWTGFDPVRGRRGHCERLCQICGEEVPLGELVHLSITRGVMETSGCGMHPKCARFALKFCPHFSRRTYESDDVIGWLWPYDGQGYEAYTDEEGDPDWDSIIGDFVGGREGSVPLTYAELREL